MRNYRQQTPRKTWQYQNLMSVSHFMVQLEEEVRQVKSGELSVSRARAVFFGRRLQLQLQGLNLQFQRLHRTTHNEEMSLLRSGDRAIETRLPDERK